MKPTSHESFLLSLVQRVEHLEEQLQNERQLRLDVQQAHEKAQRELACSRYEIKTLLVERYFPAALSMNQ